MPDSCPLSRLRAARFTAEFAWVGEASELWLNPTAPAAAASAAVKPTIWVLLGVLRLATRCLAPCRPAPGLRAALPGVTRSPAARSWDTTWPFGHRGRGTIHPLGVYSPSGSTHDNGSVTRRQTPPPRFLHLLHETFA